MKHDGRHTLVALACSAGGLGAVREILAALPADFPAPIILAQHRGDSSAEVLVQLLSAWTGLRVKSAEPMETMRAGWVYVCPPGKHIEVATEHLLHTWEGPRIGFMRPSCDLLFRSVATIFGERGVCVVLTGSGDDGALATRKVRREGGFVIAQDNSADFPEMPNAAVELGRVDLVLPLREIAFALCQLVQGPLMSEASAEQVEQVDSLTDCLSGV